MQQTINPEEGVNALEKYGINLTALAREGKIDPVIGEAGTGKTLDQTADSCAPLEIPA